MPAIERFSEIDWEPKPILRPGLDYHGGVVYVTIPLTRNLVRMSKSKPPEPIPYKELQMYTITSGNEGFWYDEEALGIEGFQPSPQVYQETRERWSNQSVRAFLAGEIDPIDTAILYKDIREVYTTYVEFADEIAYDLMTLFVMYSYVFRLFEHTGYIHFNGTQASGKSRNLSILNVLAFNTIWSSNMSPASLYRKLAGSPGTTCIDESEGFDGERGEELRRILNAGYKDGSRVHRSERGPNERWMTVEYDVFGPKALASINQFEPVIASRCMVMPMRPAIRELPDFQQSNPKWDDLRDRLYVWMMQNTAAVEALANEWRDGKKKALAPKLIARQWEISNQFVILADFVGGETLAKKVIAHLNAYFIKQQEALNATDRLRTTLRALPRVLNQKAPHPGLYYSAKDIHEVISTYLEEDAKEYFKTKHVVKNLDTIGFKDKERATGGIRIRLPEAAIRAEFAQRRVEPFDEDKDWLEGKISYQQTRPELVPDDDEVEPAWWEK